jgi:hypothetical protein
MFPKLTADYLLLIIQFLLSDTVSSISEMISIQGHIRELKKNFPSSFHLERAIFMEASHEDNHGLPYAQPFVYLLCTHARFQRRWIVALLLGQGGNTNHPEHHIYRKANALNSHTVCRIKIKNGV